MNFDFIFILKVLAFIIFFGIIILVVNKIIRLKFTKKNSFHINGIDEFWNPDNMTDLKDSETKELLNKK